LCFSEITVGELKSEESEWCPVYRKIFTVPAKDEIERLRKAAPPYRLSVIKDHKEVRVLNGIAKIRSAMADGSLSPNDLAVLGPFCPALPVRGIANGINALKKLYNPIDVFADFWSWGLVAVIPAVVLTVIGGNPALGLWWFSYLIVALLVIGGGVLITLIWSRQLVGYIVFGVLTLVTAGLAIPVGLGLLVGALVNVLILKLLHTIMRPLARLIGCLSGIERNRISNWAEWMKPVQ